jgi:capsular polysaccharide biosynthesis protein
MSGQLAAFHLPTLGEIAGRIETLVTSRTFSIPNAVAYTNVARENPEHGRHLEQEIYVPRSGVLAGIDLIALPAGATILGGGDYLLKAGAVLVAEQYPPYLPLAETHFAELLSAVRPVEEVTGETLLVARYGIFTWGHWLGELLPKIVLAEFMHPGRFSFVLPHQVLTDPSPNLPWVRLKESLFAYGIADSRIISIHPSVDYRFSSLFAITPVWSNHLMHPDAMQAMRTQLRQQNSVPSPPCLAIERISGYGRELSNYAEIRPLLLARNFECQTTGARSFLDQVSIFRETELVFSTLGSDLTNLIFAPDGVRVISVAPAIFGDRFFYALVLGRSGKLIDLRGPVTVLAEDLKHKSMFAIQPDEVVKALGIFMNS